MGSSFKKQVVQQRAAVPQVDPESIKVSTPAPLPAIEQQQALAAFAHQEAEKSASTPQILAPVQHITIVDTSEAPGNRGFFMYPSRHRQIAKDLVYIEDRKPWQIIEDALEEYVVKHYGREYKRKGM